MCRGVEENFIAFAERLEDGGKPDVNQNSYKQIIAKAVLFRVTEKLFSALGLEGYRVNTVAYALAWLATRSEHRINLSRIWDEQKVPAATQEAIKIVCQTAYQHFTQTAGDVGEWSKKGECWDSFSQQAMALDPAWESEWAETSFLVTTTSLDAAAETWERVRHHFTSDSTPWGNWRR